MPYIFLNTVADVTNFYVPTPIVILINNKHEQKCIKSKSTNIISDYKIGTGSLFLLNASVAEVLELLEEEGYSIVKINQNDRHNIWVLHKKLIFKQNTVMESGDKKSDIEEESERVSSEDAPGPTEASETLTLDKLDIINLMQTYYDHVQEGKGLGDLSSSQPDVTFIPKFLLPQELDSDKQKKIEITSRQMINLDDLKILNKTEGCSDENPSSDDLVTYITGDSIADNDLCSGKCIEGFPLSRGRDSQRTLKESSCEALTNGQKIKSNVSAIDSKDAISISQSKIDCYENSAINNKCDENLKKSAKCMSLKYVDKNDDGLCRLNTASCFRFSNKVDYDSQASVMSNAEASYTSNNSTDEENDLNSSTEKPERKNLLTLDYSSSINKIAIDPNADKSNKFSGLSKNSLRGETGLIQKRKYLSAFNNQNSQNHRSMRGEVSSLTVLKEVDKNFRNAAAFKSKIKSQPTTTSSKFSRGFKKPTQ